MTNPRSTFIDLTLRYMERRFTCLSLCYFRNTRAMRAKRHVRFIAFIKIRRAFLPPEKKFSRTLVSHREIASYRYLFRRSANKTRIRFKRAFSLLLFRSLGKATERARKKYFEFSWPSRSVASVGRAASAFENRSAAI